MLFFDWLTIFQEHPAGDLPLMGKEYKVTYDLATMAKVYETVHGFKFEGSHDTSLRVTCDGAKVEVSGNPSVFCRQDNLYGFVSMSDCVDLYNEVLNDLGLPMFVGSPASGCFHRYQYAHSDGLNHPHQPTITRTDITENLKSTDALAYIRALSGYVHQGHRGFLFPDGLTADWNGKHNGFQQGASRDVYIKYYVKENDITNKLVKNERKSNKVINLDETLYFKEKKNYLENVKGFCLENQIVRHEVSLKYKFLKKHGLLSPESWSDAVMSNIISPYQFHNKIKVEQSGIQRTIPQLLEFGVSERVAKRADVVLHAWLQGKNLHYKSDGGLGQADFYRMRKTLLLVGVDIARPADLLHMPLQSRKLEVSSLPPPDWYELPSRPRLTVVA